MIPDPVISDFSVPSDHQPETITRTASPPHYLRADWSEAELRNLALALDGPGRSALAEITDGELLDAWARSIETLLDADSPSRKLLDPALRRTARLSAPALQAALGAMFAGTVGAPAKELLARASRLPRRQHGLVVAVLAANVPGLAVQALLPALALRRPMLLKSSSREPLLSACLVHLLGRADARLAAATAALTWVGGERTLEKPVFDVAGNVVAYGDDATMLALRSRADDGARPAPGGDGLLPHGSKFSFAVVSGDADVSAAARGLAQDIALFEQRGCLSVQAIYTDAEVTNLAAQLHQALTAQADLWPPVDPEVEEAAAVQQVRQDAELRGLEMHALGIAAGTVIVDPDTTLRTGPGLRTVRLHPVADLEQLPPILEPRRGQLQGVALAGDRCRHLAPDLAALGVTRLSSPGLLQRPDALWANGGVHLLDALA